MREPKSVDDVVAARLRSVLTEAPPPAVPVSIVGAGGSLADVGGPLSWSDIIPGWPDDIDLDPAAGPPVPGAEPAPAVPPPEVPPPEVPPPAVSAAGVSAAVGELSGALRQPTGGFPATSPWATPPGAMGAAVDLQEPFLALAPGPGSSPQPPRTLPVPRSQAPWPGAGDASEPFDPSDLDDEAPRLGAAGAFGGGDEADRGWVGLRAFDPGRRGVKALAAVAAVAIVIAAVFAWRARPRVETVAPPSFDTVGAATTPGGGANAAASGSSGAAPEVVVAVAGKVRKPGLVRLPSGARVADALTAAGGAEPGVDVAMLNLARKVVDGELILVGVTPPPGAAVTTGPAAAATGGAAPAGGPVNLNTATLAELDSLPGVGPVLAQRILDARTAQGGFKSVSDLRKVDGIGDARYEQLKDLVTV